MKWLFLTLVLLNIVVFAGMIATSMFKKHAPVANSQQVQPVVINMIQPEAKSASGVVATATTASGVTTITAPAVSSNSKTRNNASPAPTAAAPRNDNNHNNKNTARNNHDNNHRTVLTNDSIARNSSNDTGVARAKYKECSARVSMPEDDYHRIKGLLGRYPHAASRQVVDNGNGESAARMNVVFMQVSDQEASAIQGVVGRYGQLNRSPCNR